VKQRRRNHPGDFPFSVVAALDANYAAKLKLHDFIFFAARDKQGDEFLSIRRKTANIRLACFRESLSVRPRSRILFGDTPIASKAQSSWPVSSVCHSIESRNKSLIKFGGMTGIFLIILRRDFGTRESQGESVSTRMQAKRSSSVAKVG
jgi:hypothetical protein